MRRFAMPITLSILAHAGLVGLLLLVPHLPNSTVGSHSPGRFLSPTINILSSPPRVPVPKATTKPAAPLPDDRESINLDIETPILVGRGSAATESGSPRSAPAGVPSTGTVWAPAPPAPPMLAVPGTARRVVYLVDRSGSMGLSGALDRARVELAASLRSLPEGTLFQVLFYNRTVVSLMPGASPLVPAEPESITRAILRLEDLPPSGSTNHVGALRQALNLRPEVLFLLTDADDLRDSEVLEVTRMNLERGQSSLHIIEMASGPGKSHGPLARLAALNSGTHRRVAPVK